MNPHWKKAYYDVVSKEDLEKWQDVALQIHYENITAKIRRLAPIYQPLFDNESWGDPQEEEFCAEAEAEWEMKYGVTFRIWESSMNQILDEEVDYSADAKLFINWNEFLKNGAATNSEI